MYMYHSRGVFLAGYGWFEGKILFFDTQIRLCHILFTDGTTDYVAAEDFSLCFIVKFLLSLCILFIHGSFVCQVSINLTYFSLLKFFWVLASSLIIDLKLFLMASYKVCPYKKSVWYN